MPSVIGLCGFAGVGKSTALSYLAEKTNAGGVYLGDIVLEEVRRRGLPESRESEKIVRSELREHNRAELVSRSIEHIRQILISGRSVIVDAILLPEERECLIFSLSGYDVYILKISVELEHRVDRLGIRAKRPHTIGEIQDRDNFEVDRLHIDHVFKMATHAIDNNGVEEKFKNDLDEFIQAINI
ncbi:MULTISPECIES: AAA family ATPase [Methylobacterium]|uniref:AAA family ATPase n=1 Tax=Methylobacterium TaxID=407 RepID=UPI0013EA678F|nr:AAA family ATPase [Methylobacterium sp. DB0501]NGM34499.1 AAA family ATPase [Methylobacterium sp. DB0501]